MTASARRRRVLFVSGHADVVGGGQVSLLLLLRLLDKDRFLPMLLCPKEGEVARRARDLGIEVYFLDGDTPMDSIMALWQALALRRYVRTLAADVVHCDTIYTALACGAGLAGTRVPVIFHARTSEPGGPYDTIASVSCTKIIAVSNATAKRFSASAPSKVVVIYNGVDLSEFCPGSGSRGLRQKLGIAEDAFVIGYAGQVIKRKGLDVLIRAFSRLRAQAPTAKLLIAGRGGDEVALRAIAGDDVLFLPFSDAMPEFYSALDVFVLPTLHPEGLSRSLIESMACTVPSVATSVGGNEETVVDGETGYFVPAQDEGALYDRLRQLYLAPEGRSRMGAAARKRAERLFDAAACTRAVEALYLQVCT
jgi:glycosyltransferase involved in cell wall biosynthesis